VSKKSPTQLRANAEAQLAQSPPSEASARSDKELLHELQVHQIELGMQNEALRRALWLSEEAEQIGKVGGWAVDISTGKQTWTAETYRIHEVGLDYEPTVEKGINFYTPESRPTIERAVRKAIEHGEPFDL
jgi:hypothetical protein